MTISPFDQYSSRYEQWFEENRWVYESELSAVEKRLPKGKGIEIGVGTGRFAEPLGIQIGVEPSSSMAELAEQKGIKVVIGKAESLPFISERFDFALMVTTICFVDDIDKSFHEAFRILKMTGKLIIGFVDKESFLGELYQKKKDKSVFYKSARFFSVKEVLSSLRLAGFSNFKISQTIFRDLDCIDNLEPILEGYGKGAFVVIVGEKKG